MYVDLHILIYNLAFAYVNVKDRILPDQPVWCFHASVSWNRLLDGEAGLLAINNDKVIQIALTAIG